MWFTATAAKATLQQPNRELFCSGALPYLPQWKDTLRGYLGVLCYSYGASAFLSHTRVLPHPPVLLLKCLDSIYHVQCAFLFTKYSEMLENCIDVKLGNAFNAFSVQSDHA